MLFFVVLPLLAQTTPVQSTSSPYKGEQVSFELTNVDIKDFFELIGSISGLDVTLEKEVRGSLSLFVKDAPWDQTLDSVANNQQIGIQRQGNSLRVTSKPQGIPQGRIVFDMDLLQDGLLLARPRLITAEGIPAIVVRENLYRLKVTPTKVAGGKVEVDYEVNIKGKTATGKSLVVTKEAAGTIALDAPDGAYAARIILLSGA